MSGEKTEEPTQKKIRDARKKGQVAKSADANSTALLLIVFAYFWIGWDSFLKDLKELLLLPTFFYSVEFSEALSNVKMAVILKVILIIAPIISLVMVTGIAANLAQVGFLLAFDGLKPDLNRLNPVEGMKKIFSKKGFVEFLKSCAKVTFLGILLYSLVKGVIDPLMKIPAAGIIGIIQIIPAIMKKFAIYVGLAYFLVAVFDVIFQRRQHWNQLKMSKDEVKREYKEMEGDPHIKGKRKQLQREMATEDSVQRTKKSTVVVTNPTEYAIALYYNETEAQLPIVYAKGYGYTARMMVEAAKDNNIPIMQNIPLAHALFDHVPIEHYIPSDLIKAVAEVLIFVNKIKQQQEAQASVGHF
jgi:type III secretion protein U